MVNRTLTVIGIFLVIISPMVSAVDEGPAPTKTTTETLQNPKETTELYRTDSELPGAPSALLQESPITSKSQSLPEPNGLVALAFAGVVILVRHRFRPS